MVAGSFIALTTALLAQAGGAQVACPHPPGALLAQAPIRPGERITSYQSGDVTGWNVYGCTAEVIYAFRGHRYKTSHGKVEVAWEGSVRPSDMPRESATGIQCTGDGDCQTIFWSEVIAADPRGRFGDTSEISMLRLDRLWYVCASHTRDYGIEARDFSLRVGKGPWRRGGLWKYGVYQCFSPWVSAKIIASLRTHPNERLTITYRHNGETIVVINSLTGIDVVIDWQERLACFDDGLCQPR